LNKFIYLLTVAAAFVVSKMLALKWIFLQQDGGSRPRRFVAAVCKLFWKCFDMLAIKCEIARVVDQQV